MPTKSEIAYARLAAKTPHIVLSKTLKSVSWPAAQIIRDVTELRTLKRQPGKNIYVVGGATLVASLLNENSIDELRLIVHPLVLGKGQALFSGVNKRLSLDLVQAEVHRVRQSDRDLPNCECCERRGSVGLGPGARGRTPMTTHLTGAHNAMKPVRGFAATTSTTRAEHSSRMGVER